MLITCVPSSCQWTKHGTENTEGRILTDMLLLALVVLPLLVESSPIYKEVLPLDCQDIYDSGSNASGVYTIYPAGQGNPVEVYCDMGCDEIDDHKDKKWTVIQRRMDGSVNFYRPWDQYKNGFGNLSGEYWLGLENIFLMTYMEKYELRVDMEDFEGGSAYALYTQFYIDGESSNYRLHVGGFINGGAGESLIYSNGQNFATFDKDYNGCAATYGGGFWYNYGGGYWYYYWQCHNANPNGIYKWGAVSTPYTGVMWNTFMGSSYSLKTFVMKIRRLSLEEIQQLS